MANRNYSSVARAATLTAGVSGSATTIPVSETTGFPSVPFTLVIDPGRTAEEIITVTAVVGTSLTAVRGEDGTTAVPHDAGATVRHMATARDFRESGEHISSTGGVHGVLGSVVGDIDGQTLDNKTFQAIGTDHTAVVVKQGNTQTAPLLVFQEPGGSPILSISNNGGLVETGSQTLRPAASGGTPLNVQGVSGQSAPLTVYKDSSGTVLASVDQTGKFSGSFAGPLTGDVTANTVNTGTMRAQTTGTGIPIYGLIPEAGTQYPFAVRGNDVAAARAGIKPPTEGWQLFHGGGSGNVVPFKMFGGSIGVTIASGTTSIGATINYAGANFDTTPLVFLTVRQDNASTLQRRVTANVEEIPGINSCGIRVIQTAGENVPSNTNYRVYWMAVQFLPTSALSFP